ncbi:MAG: zinc-ribbon domain-containing protein [Clostridia bacterium]|nr:zinc-ribbon domain-containing protein [Clostridia bacterium]
MFCKHCGTEIQENAEYCINCGAKVKEEQTTTPPTDTYSNQQYTQPTNSNKINGMSIAGFILSFLGGVLGLVFSILGYNQAKREGTPTGLGLAGIIISVIMMTISVIVSFVYGAVFLELFYNGYYY